MLRQCLYPQPETYLPIQWSVFYSVEWLMRLSPGLFLTKFSTFQNLKDVLANKIPEKQKEVKEFRSKHGNTKVGEITVDMVRPSTFF